MKNPHFIGVLHYKKNINDQAGNIQQRKNQIKSPTGLRKSGSMFISIFKIIKKFNAVMINQTGILVDH